MLSDDKLDELEVLLEHFIGLVIRHSKNIATTLTYAVDNYFPVVPEFERHGEWFPLNHDSSERY
ncbi:hypothetical protein LZT28_22540 [Aeromonas media]|uniref:Uncharacterized protein n=1 Tax=Aeromonas media TaxID=651 RepID=A0AAW5RS13_AERME|nr:hypothetical protein [Aeromonas media]MCV3290958.1 hypothetical protein [Aeromonas media]